MSIQRTRGTKKISGHKRQRSGNPLMTRLVNTTNINHEFYPVFETLGGQTSNYPMYSDEKTNKILEDAKKVLENDKKISKNQKLEFFVPVFTQNNEYTSPTSPINNEKKRKADTEEMLSDTEELVHSIVHMPEADPLTAECNIDTDPEFHDVLRILQGQIFDFPMYSEEGNAQEFFKVLERDGQLTEPQPTVARMPDNNQEQNSETSKYNNLPKVLIEKLSAFEKGDDYTNILKSIRSFFNSRKDKSDESIIDDLKEKLSHKALKNMLDILEIKDKRHVSDDDENRKSWVKQAIGLPEAEAENVQKQINETCKPAVETDRQLRFFVPVFTQNNEYTSPTSPINNEKKRKADTEEMLSDTEESVHSIVHMPEADSLLEMNRRAYFQDIDSQFDAVFASLEEKIFDNMYCEEGNAQEFFKVLERDGQLTEPQPTVARMPDDNQEQNILPIQRNKNKKGTLEKRLLQYKKGDGYTNILPNIRVFFHGRKDKSDESIIDNLKEKLSHKALENMLYILTHKKNYGIGIVSPNQEKRISYVSQALGLPEGNIKERDNNQEQSNETITHEEKRKPAYSRAQYLERILLQYKKGDDYTNILKSIRSLFNSRKDKSDESIIDDLKEKLSHKALKNMLDILEIKDKRRVSDDDENRKSWVKQAIGSHEA